MPDLEGVDPTLAARVRQLQGLCPGTTITSGARSTAQQQKLYDDWKAGRLDVPAVAEPGTSHHETGRAVDVGGNQACIESHLGMVGLDQTVDSEWWHLEVKGANKPNSATRTSPPADPIAHTEALVMSTLLGENDPVVEAAAGRDVTTSGQQQPTGGATTTGGAPAPGGDWQASLSPDERWILTKESGLNPTAQNPTSTAFGIWQGLESTRKQYLGDDWQTTDPVKQLDAFRRYVTDRYGSAAAAKAHWESEGWY